MILLIKEGNGLERLAFASKITSILYPTCDFRINQGSDMCHHFFLLIKALLWESPSLVGKEVFPACLVVFNVTFHRVWTLRSSREMMATKGSFSSWEPFLVWPKSPPSPLPASSLLHSGYSEIQPSFGLQGAKMHIWSGKYTALKGEVKLQRLSAIKRNGIW